MFAVVKDEDALMRTNLSLSTEKRRRGPVAWTTSSPPTRLPRCARNDNGDFGNPVTLSDIAGTIPASANEIAALRSQ